MTAAILSRSRELPLAVAVAGFAMAYSLAPTENGPVRCLLRLHTGHACPGCGMTRALGRVVHGDIGGAAAYHPWVLALVAQVVIAAGWRMWWGRRPLQQQHLLQATWLVTANVGALVVVWLIRMATGHLAGVY